MPISIYQKVRSLPVHSETQKTAMMLKAKKSKKSQKIVIAFPIANTNGQMVSIHTTVGKYSFILDYWAGDAVENALKRIEEENVTGIGFTTANGTPIQVRLLD